jgi:nitrate reductase gamma subunit
VGFAARSQLSHSAGVVLLLGFVVLSLEGASSLRKTLLRGAVKMAMSVLSVINTAGLLAIGIIALLNNRKVQQVHLLVNSRLTELLELTKKSSYAEGIAQQKKEEDNTTLSSS